MTKLDDVIRAMAALEIARGTMYEREARRALKAIERDFMKGV